MVYERPNRQKDINPTNLELQFGKENFSIPTDPAWVDMSDLHNDGCFALNQMKSAIEQSKSMNLDDFKEDVAKERRLAPIKAARQALLTFVEKHIQAAAEDIEKSKNVILRVTAPPVLKGDEMVLNELRMREIRDVVRVTDPRRRADLIRDNPDFIKAVIQSPEPLISQDNLLEIRRQYAIRNDPSLKQMEDDAVWKYQAIRSRASEISAHSIMMLVKEKMDDPLDPADHFRVFTPQNEYESTIAKRRIEEYQRKKAAQDKKKMFDEKNPGINLQAERKMPSTAKARARQ